MRIGIIPELNPAAGGVHQYALTIIDALAELQRGGLRDNFVLLLSDYQPPAEVMAALPAWPRLPLFQPLPWHKRAAIKLLGGARAAKFSARLRGKTHLSHAATGELKNLENSAPAARYGAPPLRAHPATQAWQRANGIAWNFFLGPQALAAEIGLPFVMPIHDLQHRLQPEFVETTADGEFEYREYLYQHAVKNALLLIADSETGKEDILNVYGALGAIPERIAVLPFYAAAYMRERPAPQVLEQVRAQYQLPERFFFYPAQFWPHKNHKRIVQALAHLRDQANERVAMVFCGAHSKSIREACFADVQATASRLGVAEQITYLQYVPNDAMAALYCLARGLVMPTFFGPTNIPPIEAWGLDCPVITSDIRGIREQVGPAALLADPRSAESIADAMLKLWRGDTLRAELVQHGRERLGQYTFKDFVERLGQIVTTANKLAPQTL